MVGEQYLGLEFLKLFLLFAFVFFNFFGGFAASVFYTLGAVCGREIILAEYSCRVPRKLQKDAKCLEGECGPG